MQSHQARDTFARYALLIVCLLTVLAATAQAATHDSIGYQGYLTDGAGQPITAVQDITFNIYTVSSGGIPLWTETQAVMIDQGLFSVQLGADPLNPLVDALFDTELWLGITVVGDIAELTPRQELDSSAFARRAFAADTLGGLSATDLDQSAHVTDTGNPHAVTAAQTGAATAADLTTHEGNASAHHSKTTSFTELTGQIGDGQIPDVITRDTEVYTQAQVDALLATRDSEISAQAARLAALEAKLQYLTTSGTEMTITGANLRVVSGSGATDGAINGLGNIIIGYNESRSYGDLRTGSHNLVIGMQQDYGSYGGMVVGESNFIFAPFASVSGGIYNTARGYGASVSGGNSNTSWGSYASISGGAGNSASGQSASVSGGNQNGASGPSASVSGGDHNSASGESASVSGGRTNIASGKMASVAGGGGGALSADGNIAFADYSSILGGRNSLAGDGSCTYDATANRYFCTAGTDHSIGAQSAIVGGQGNQTTGAEATVGGGIYNRATGNIASVTGGGGNLASGLQSSATGGQFNTASGEWAAVSGGQGNTANGNHASVSGGVTNTASGGAASISGGFTNVASGNSASVSGGDYNSASGSAASVSGGASRSATGIDDWVAGALFQDF